MLTHIHIKNFAIVESLDLDIPNQLCVITGETGAGKSIMIDALGLALGNRADSNAVRHGKDNADIFASFDIQSNPSAKQWLKKMELEAGDECILRRVINKDGRSRAYVNGTPTPLTAVRALGESLVSIHGQHEHQALLKTETHRRLLDQFGSLNSLAASINQHFNDWKQQQALFEQFRDNAQDINDRADLLSFQLTELQQLDLQKGEFNRLEKEHKRLANTETLLSQGQQVLDCLNGSNQSLLDQTSSQLTRMNSMLQQDDTLIDTCKLLESAHIQLQETTDQLQHYVETLEIDPERYQHVDQRISTAHQLARKHRVTPDQLPSLQETLQAELDQISGGDDKLDKLSVEASNLKSVYYEKAKTLSKKRHQSAKTLGKQISQQIETLGMPGAELSIQLLPVKDNEPTPHGLEHIEFHIQTNPGQPCKPLHKVASGGELSRISLSIQVACAAQSDTSTLIFDEVDVGIGGGIAQVVGRLLRALGQNNQVICVTHLPQVAAQGHYHLHVDKTTEASTTQTNITSLNAEKKVVEIARMLGGLTITDQTLAHASELIKESQT